MSLNDQQRTEAWYKARAGCATASAFADVLAIKKNGKPLKARTDYLWKVATERLYGTPTESISARALEWGKELEPFAIQAYEEERGVVVRPSGFVLHPQIAHCGGSPDGLCGEEGGIEIKCPKDRRVHMQTWHGGMPEEHKPQVQGNLWITGRKWFDFISYDPRAPKQYRLYIERICRDESYIANLKNAVCAFLSEVDDLLKDIDGKQRRDLQEEDVAVG